jgi:hypothetical protein
MVEVIEMRLTWRDVFASFFVLVGLAFAYSAIQCWGWPLMNGARAGILALGVTGILACSASGWASEGPAFYKSPFFIVGAILGVVLFALVIIGLIAGTVVFLEWMMAAFAAIWVVTLLQRIFAGSPTARPTAI